MSGVLTPDLLARTRAHVAAMGAMFGQPPGTALPQDPSQGSQPMPPAPPSPYPQGPPGRMDFSQDLLRDSMQPQQLPPQAPGMAQGFMDPPPSPMGMPPKPYPPSPVGTGDMLTGSAPSAAPQVPTQAPPGPGGAAYPYTDTGGPPTPASGRYGPLAAGLVGGESGGNAASKNPNSTASGVLQFLDGTFGDFVKSPANTKGWTLADKNKSEAQMDAAPWYLGQTDAAFQHKLGRDATNPELQASWLFGQGGTAALAANPAASAYDVLKSVDPKNVDSVFKNNAGTGLSPTMTAGQAITTVSDYYNKHAGASGAAAQGAPAAPATAAPPGAPQAAAAPPEDFQAPYPDAARPRSGDALLALASGLLQGPSPSIGMGKGLQTMLSVQQGQREAEMKANTEYMALHRLGIEDKYRNSLMVATLRRGDQADTRLGQGGQRVDIAQQNADQGGARVDIAQQNANTAGGRLANAQNVTNQRFDPTVAANMKTGVEQGEAAGKDITNLQSTRSADDQSLKDTEEAGKLIAANPGMMGPTLMARGTRALAEMGIAGSADNLNAVQKMTADARNTYLTSLTGGHVGGIRSNAELKNLSQAVADVNTSPAAAQWIISMQKRQIMARQAWREELAQRQNDPATAGTVTGTKYFGTKDAFTKSYLDANPLPDYSSAPAPAAPAPAASTSPVSGTTTGGVKWSFTPSSQ